MPIPGVFLGVTSTPLQSPLPGTNDKKPTAGASAGGEPGTPVLSLDAGHSLQ